MDQGTVKQIQFFRDTKEDSVDSVIYLNDLFQTISDEVDWANAPKLTVSCIRRNGAETRRKGKENAVTRVRAYGFGVEFIPLSVYGFEKWLAFPTVGFAEWFEQK